jgi:hypothetical protein
MAYGQGFVNVPQRSMSPFSGNELFHLLFDRMASGLFIEHGGDFFNKRRFVFPHDMNRMV